MKFVLLTKRPESYSVNRLLEAGRAQGHEIEAIDFTRCTLTAATHEPKVLHGGQPLEGVNGVITRIAASSPYYGTAVVRQFEMQDVVCLNGSLAIARCRDKLRTMQILTRRGVGMPRTTVAAHPDDVDSVLRWVGPPPYIIKVIEGSQGVGVVKADSVGAARSVIETLQALEANILVQEFIAEAAGSDVRCFVVGDRVVAAMKRTGASDDFRSNLHRGGTAIGLKPSPAERETAVAAARAMGLRVAGVDLLQSDRGPLVMEVNSSPGLEGIEGATGKDVAGKIVDYLARMAPRGHRGDRSFQH